jgi:hypothetical protein
VDDGHELAGSDNRIAFSLGDHQHSAIIALNHIFDAAFLRGGFLSRQFLCACQRF